MPKPESSCVEPAKGPILSYEDERNLSIDNKEEKKEIKMVAKVGKKAPDFEATAFVDGEFKNIKLSDYKGKWVVLCFYPGDFTFV